MNTKIKIDRDELAEFCRRWKIRELSVFGSVLREDFGPESDIDVLISFDPGAEWSLWDHFNMKVELSGLTGRKVDLVTRRSIEQSPNWIRKKAILEGAESIYVQG